MQNSSILIIFIAVNIWQLKYFVNVCAFSCNMRTCNLINLWENVNPLHIRYAVH